MKKGKIDSKLHFALRVITYLERFKFVPLSAWGIFIGLVTIVSVMRPLIWPNMTSGIQIIIYIGSVLIAFVISLVYVYRKPTQSQLMMESELHYNSGSDALEKKEYTKAYKELESAYKKHASFRTASEYATVLLRRGDYSRSIIVYTHAFDLSPTADSKTETLRNRGVAAMCDRNWKLAYKDFSSYVTTKTTTVESPAGYRLLSLVEYNMDDFDSAEEHARKAVKLAPERPTTHATLSVILARKDLEKSKKEFLEAISLKKINHTGDELYAIAQASVAHEDIDLVFGRLERAVCIDSKFSFRARKDPIFEKLRVYEQRFDSVIDTHGLEYCREESEE
jgi:tetratricopeptide (TPR) repeat protein